MQEWKHFSENKVLNALEEHAQLDISRTSGYSGAMTTREQQQSQIKNIV